MCGTCGTAVRVGSQGGCVMELKGVHEQEECCNSEELCNSEDLCMFVGVRCSA